MQLKFYVQMVEQNELWRELKYSDFADFIIAQKISISNSEIYKTIDNHANSKVIPPNVETRSAFS